MVVQTSSPNADKPLPGDINDSVIGESKKNGAQGSLQTNGMN